MKIKNLRISAILILSLSLFILSGFVYADENKNLSTAGINQIFNLNIDKATISKGYTVNIFNKLKLSLAKGVLTEDTSVNALVINEDIISPNFINRISDIYQFEFSNKKAYNNQSPFVIQLSYNKSSNYLKQVYYYDKNKNGWIPLPSFDYPNEKFVRSYIHLPFARLAVFENPFYLTVGKASWYKYKNGNFAASPDFPKGSKLKVTNLENNKSVIVEINDYGPARLLHPDRVVDLDKIAFNKIASTNDGVIKISVNPILIKGINIEESSIIKSKAGIIMDEDSGEILWSKNSSMQLPLASLTKIIAMKIYLELNPDLNKVITYSFEDEKQNNKYVKYAYEAAKVKLDDGDTLTVKDLVYSSLVGSANNSVETLVRNSGVNREEFIRIMNETVKSLGATSTSFADPAGLSPKNVSSPKDYAIIVREAFKNSVIKDASITSTYKFTTLTNNKDHKILNTNKLILTNKYLLSGSKTGYLEEAGYCLMVRVKSNSGNNYVINTFNAPDRNSSFLDVEKLIIYAKNN